MCMLNFMFQISLDTRVVLDFLTEKLSEPNILKREGYKSTTEQEPHFCIKLSVCVSNSKLGTNYIPFHFHQHKTTVNNIYKDET